MSPSKHVQFDQVSLPELDEMIQRHFELMLRELQPMKKSIQQIERRIFHGTERRPSIDVELAIFGERLETMSAWIGKQGGGPPPPSEGRRLPDHFWKATGAILVAIATAIAGTLAAEKQTSSLPPAQHQTPLAQQQSRQ